MHLYDPHEPYAPPDEYRRRAPTAYAGEVMYADAQVARLLEALDALGLRRNTVVVYLSDHGESLGEHGEPTHGIFLYGATLDVPLIIAPPPGAALGSPARRAGGTARAGAGATGGRHADGARPRRAARAVRPRRREPAAAGGARGAAAAGRRRSRRRPSDALAGPVSYAETYYPRFHYDWSELVAVETERWKFVRAPRPELYDVRQDPKELHDVSAATRASPRRSPRTSSR